MGFIIYLVNMLFNILYLLILARIIFSFIQVSPYHPTWGPVLRAVYNLTEPILAPVRRFLPPMAGLDFSPMIVLILASVVRQLLIQLLVSMV
jgi:YggT family protein